MFLRKIIYILFLPLLIGSCIYPFDPPSEDYENLLVVEAFLTDSDDAFEVVLSRSIPIDTGYFLPEENALISISDNLGGIYDFYEENPGRYMSFPDFTAQTGRIYRLHIQTTDGKQYESDSVFLRETPPIDSVLFKYEERVAAEGEKDIQGLQIYVSTHDTKNSTWFYRWDYKETWEFRSKYRSLQIWEDDMVKDRKDQIYRCWKNYRSSNVFVATSNTLNEDIISEFPLVYVSNSTDRLMSKYSILVKQYALSEESYTYWKELEKINENLGTFFDPQPSTIKGNIYNINDENEIVLGYFDGSSVQEKRIFISKGEYPSIVTPNNYAHCSDTIVSYFQIRSLLNEGYMLVGGVAAQTPSPRYLLSYESCIDCTLFGTNVEPDFWD
jgi:hypothetical protein